MDITRKLAAEFLGTFWLVLGGCGAALIAHGIGTMGVALAFGFALLTASYAFHHISDAHFNPALTLGLYASGRFPGRDVIPYWIVQVAGAIAAAAVLFLIARGLPDFDVSHFDTNGYGENSPLHYPLAAAVMCEIVLSAMFVLVVLGTSSEGAPQNFAPLAAGLAFALVYLISIPVTNGGINPARSTGVAVLQYGWAMDQLWLFWAAPLTGGLIAGLVQRWFAKI